jgi:hypothetical protein
MTPSPTTYLDGLARQLGEQVAARLPTLYEQAGMLREPMHLQAVRIEFERAAARRVEENQAIRALLRRGAGLSKLTDERRVAWREAADQTETDLRVSVLQRHNDQLRLMLIELHEALEQRLEQADAQALLEAVWQELRDSTERRRLPADRF